MDGNGKQAIIQIWI